jgi:hypothetical protein
MVARKKIFFPYYLVLFLAFCVNVHSDELVARPFPDQIEEEFLLSYIKDKHDLPLKELRQEYIYILIFFNECISVFNENISIYCSSNSFIQRHPSVRDGKLCFEEEEKTFYILDNETQQYRKVADISIIGETINMIIAYTTYNQFIDHWFLLTGEVLGAKYDIDETIASLKYDDPGKAGIRLLEHPVPIIIPQGLEQSIR